MILQTTLSLAAAAALLNVWLAVRTGKVRFGSKVWHGDGGSPILLQRMRAHANYIEYTPFVLILVAAIDLSGNGGLWLAIVGALYLLARIATPSAWTNRRNRRCARWASSRRYWLCWGFRPWPC